MGYNWLKTFEEFDKELWDKIGDYDGRSKKITIDQAVSLYKENCRKWDLNEKPIYRGVYIDSDYFYIDPKGKYRASANAFGNTYNSFFDVIPSWEGVPKRSESVIMTNNLSVSETYGDAHVMIPYDNYEMVVCPSGDIWGSFYLDHIDNMYILSDLDSDILELFDSVMGKSVRVNSGNIKAICDEMDSLSKKDIPTKYQYNNSDNAFVIAWLKTDLKLFDFVSKLLEFDDKFKIVNNQKDLLSTTSSPNWSNEIWGNGEFLGINLEVYEEFKKMVRM